MKDKYRIEMIDQFGYYIYMIGCDRYDDGNCFK